MAFIKQGWGGRKVKIMKRYFSREKDSIKENFS